MEISGHRNMAQVAAYIEVRDEQVLGAVTGLSMLSPASVSEIVSYFGDFQKGQLPDKSL
jgi:integrase/recombinase XerD